MQSFYASNKPKPKSWAQHVGEKADKTSKHRSDSPRSLISAHWSGTAVTLESLLNEDVPVSDAHSYVVGVLDALLDESTIDTWRHKCASLKISFVIASNMASSKLVTTVRAPVVMQSGVTKAVNLLLYQPLAKHDDVLAWKPTRATQQVQVP